MHLKCGKKRLGMAGIISFSVFWIYISSAFAQGLDTQRQFFENLEGFPVLEDAQRVMGRNYFGLDETLRTFGILMFRGEVPPIPFKFRTLLEHKDCLLVLTLPVFNRRENDVIEFSSRFSGKEPTSLKELAKGRFYHVLAQSWWPDHEFSKQPLNLQWRLACFRTGLELPFQLHERNLRANERIAPANLAVYALLHNPSITGEFFTSDKNNQGLEVYIKRGQERIIFPEHVFMKSQRISGLAVEVLPDK